MLKLVILLLFSHHLCGGRQGKKIKVKNENQLEKLTAMRMYRFVNNEFYFSIVCRAEIVKLIILS